MIRVWRRGIRRDSLGDNDQGLEEEN